MNLRDLAAEFGVSVAILKKFMPDMFDENTTGSTLVHEDDVKLARDAWMGIIRQQHPDFFVIIDQTPPDDRERIVQHYADPILRLAKLYYRTGHNDYYVRLQEMLRQGLEMSFDAGCVHERMAGEAAVMSVAEALVHTTRQLVNLAPANDTTRGKTAKINIDLTVGLSDNE